MEIEITKMTSKGQVVIPQDIRKKAGVRDGERFFVYVNGDSIVFKKTKGLESADDLGEFEKIFKSMWKIAKERNISKEEIEKEIKAVRHNK